MPRRKPDFSEKHRFDDGSTLEMKIYAIGSAVSGSRHRLKYSLFYGKGGVRLVGYDNERPKGDHRHYGGVEETYTFSTVEQLIADFMKDVAAIRRSRVHET
jgi:hypothetical protein